MELTSLLVLYRGPQLCNQKGPLSYRWKRAGIEPASVEHSLTHTRKSAIQQRYPSALPGSAAHNNAGLRSFDRSGRSCSERSLVRFHLCPFAISGRRDMMPSNVTRYCMSDLLVMVWLPTAPCKVGIIGIEVRFPFGARVSVSRVICLLTPTARTICASCPQSSGPSHRATSAIAHVCRRSRTDTRATADCVAWKARARWRTLGTQRNNEFVYTHFQVSLLRMLRMFGLVTSNRSASSRGLAPASAKALIRLTLAGVNLQV